MPDDVKARELLAAAVGCVAEEDGTHLSLDDYDQVFTTDALRAIETALKDGAGASCPTAAAAQSPPPVSEGVEARDVWHCPPRTDFSTADGTKPNLSCSWCKNRVPITHYGLCNECLDELPLSASPPGCDAETIEACAKVAERWAGTRQAAGYRDKVAQGIAIAAAIRNLGKEQG